MKQIRKLFFIGLKQIVKDGMLLVLFPVPFLAGAASKFGIPFINGILESEFSFSLLPWYNLVDGMLVCITPMFMAMVSAFLLLDERGEGVSSFYQITPVGGKYYLAARIGIPMVWAFAVTIIVAMVFHISDISFGVIVLSSLLSSLTGIALAMMVVSIAENRVEGLAISKLMGISFLGLILLWFLPGQYVYLCSFLPSFWIGKLIMDGGNLLTLILGCLCCLLWTILFSRKFLSRIE